MIFLLNKSIKMATAEIAEYYSKDQNEIDFDALFPYLLLVVLKAVV